VQVLAPRALRCAVACWLAAVGIERVGGVRVERGFEVLGVRADALGLRGEVMFGPLVADVRERVGLAGERGRPVAVSDPRREAEVVGEVQQLLGRDPQPGARVGVVADHRRVHGHRDPAGLLGVLRVTHPEQEPALQQVQHALEDLLLVLGARPELREVLHSERRLEPGGAVGRDLVDDALRAEEVVRLVDQQRHPRAL
jgi:hypothetical protein